MAEAMRKIEIWDPIEADWIGVPFKELRKGHVFRMFEPGDDKPVVDTDFHDDDEPISAWVCIGDSFTQDPPAHFGVNTVPVPGF